jgi:hypothetical protein
MNSEFKGNRVSDSQTQAALPSFIDYRARTRAYYLALGYDNPYEWAHHDTTPFAPLRQPLQTTRVAIATTAATVQPGQAIPGPGAVYDAAYKFYEVAEFDRAHPPQMTITHVAIDRQHTDMSDPNTWYPGEALAEAAQSGWCQLAPKAYQVPTNRSQRHTLEVDAPDLLSRCQRDGVQALILVANCPICHQTVSLLSRHVEAHGIPTVIMGCAKDVVEHCGVARFVFSDFPLGNAAGKPNDPESQRDTLQAALRLLQDAQQPNTTWISPQRWADDDDWKLDYSNPDRMTPEQLQAARAEAEQVRLQARELRLQTLKR